MSLLAYKDVYVEGQPVVDENVIDELQQLSQIVANNHFAYVGYHDREDLLLEGQAKGLELIKSCRFDPDYGAPLKNFVYTGMRNEMTNYLYRKKREYPVEEFYGDQNKSAEMSLEEYKLDYRVIEGIINKYKKRYGDYSGIVVDSLREMGFDVQVDKKLIELEDYDKNLKRRLVIICIWRIREYFL
mgnify:CR=1 FL=1